MTGVIRRSDSGAVRILAIDRQERRNALTPEAADELRGELLRAERDPVVGAVVLTGAGGHFSAGGDAHAIVSVIDGTDDNTGDDAPDRLMRTFHRLVLAVWESPLPVVASVAGVAYGGAFNLALACDLIVCAADARFCQVFLRRGVAPDCGGAFLLPRLVGLQRAKELMLLAPELDAAQAQRLGLVNAVLPDAASALAHATELAGRLADGPRFAVAQAKRLLNASTGMDLPAALALEAAVQAGLLRSRSARDGFGDFLARRDAGRG